MHRFFQRTTIAVIALLAVGSLQTRQPALAFQDTKLEVVLTEGTPLHVVTTQAITSKTANLNDVINFKVDEDVVVNGQVVIRKGTPALGSVMHATKGGYMGSLANSEFRSNRTQTADEAQVKLRAAKGDEGDDETNKVAVLTMISPLGLFKKGGEAKIEEGTRVTVYIAEEKRFRLEDGKLVAVAPAPVDPRSPPLRPQRPSFMSIVPASGWVKRSSHQSSSMILSWPAWTMGVTSRSNYRRASTSFT